MLGPSPDQEAARQRRARSSSHLRGAHPVRSSRGFILAFGIGCLLSSAYGFRAGTWPFGVVEIVWAAVAFNRYRQTPSAQADERVTVGA